MAKKKTPGDPGKIEDKNTTGMGTSPAPETGKEAAPLLPIREHLEPLVEPAKTTKVANGNGHSHGYSGTGKVVPLKGVRQEPDHESLDPSQQQLDDFSPEHLKAAQDYGEDDMGLSGAMSLIKVQRPQAKAFFRCNPDPATHINVRLIKNDLEGVGDKKFYFVPERMKDHPALVDHWRWYTLFPLVTRQGVHYLWPVGTRDEDGVMQECHLSARKALALARTKWVRCWWVGQANMWKEMPKDRAENIPEPIFRPEAAHEVVRVALADFTIDGPDHLIVKHLEGRA
jgi:hypothetical protein